MILIRLPNGYGSVYKLSGNRRKPWIARKTIGWDENKKQLYYTIGYFRTRAEALSALAEYNKNPIGEARDTTLQEHYDKWSERYYKPLTQSAVNGYKAAWNRLKVLGEYELRLIRKSHMQDIIEEMKEKGLSRSTMEKYKTLAVLLWDEAMAEDIVDRNYGSLLDLPPARKAKKSVFTEIEIKDIEKAALGGNIWAGTILILIYTGMRVGELLALTRFNLDLENWVITGGIKTDAGRDRPVPVHPKIRKYITHWVNHPGRRLIHRDGNPIS